MTDATGLLSADVFVNVQLPHEQEALIVGALTALGVSARVRVLPRRRSSGLQWLILAALPLQAFLTGIGGRIADDAYKRFQDTVRKLLRREPADQASAIRPMVLQDAVRSADRPRPRPARRGLPPAAHPGPVKIPPRTGPLRPYTAALAVRTRRSRLSLNDCPARGSAVRRH